MSRTKELIDYLRKNGYDVEIVKVTKNGVEIEGIRFNVEGDIQPVCYESAYPAEMSIKEIAEEMALSTKNIPTFDFNIFNYTDMSEKLFPCLGNEKATKNAVRRNVCGDYYEYVRCFFTDEQNTVVTKELLEAWGVSESELFGMAMANAMAEERFISDSFLGALYILTSTTKLFGAAAVLDTALLDEACDDLRSDEIYILPSSIHELIVVSADEEDLEGLVSIVKEVNGIAITEREFLGNDVMRYNSETKTLTIA